MLKLPNVTLIALTGKDFEGHKKAVNKSCEGIEWGGVKIIWDETIDSIDTWNYKVIYELHRYVETPFCMLIHADGYVIHPQSWQASFLDYDYIGAPWPLPRDDFSYRDSRSNLVRVGNSVSLRSKKLMELAATRPWQSYYGNTNEDGFIACHQRNWLEEQGCTFAPLDVAKYFSKEHELPENQGIETFAFHSL